VTKTLKRSRYKDVRVIYIDEAQDLNKTQYEIVMYLKK